MFHGGRRFCWMQSRHRGLYGQGQGLSSILTRADWKEWFAIAHHIMTHMHTQIYTQLHTNKHIQQRQSFMEWYLILKYVLQTCFFAACSIESFVNCGEDALQWVQASVWNIKVPMQGKLVKELYIESALSSPLFFLEEKLYVLAGDGLG